MKARKYLIDKEACCSDCGAHYDGKGVDAWAKKHATETGHIVTITETHDVANFQQNAEHTGEVP